MATGDQSGTWGDTTNTNLGTLLEQAITGYVAIAKVGTGDYTLSNTDYAANENRNALIEFTGTPGGAFNVVVPLAEKLWVFKNSTDGAMTVKGASGTTITVATGTSRWLFCDGTNVLDALTGTLATQAASSVAITGGTITGLTSLTLASGAATPATNDAAALGTTTLMWSDLFLASGAVVNWNNGDVTMTHAANTLTFAGASSGYAFTGGPVVPATSDVAALGTSTLMWSDLFLASGGVINFDNGNYTLTHSAGVLTANGALSIGTGNALTAGTIELGAATDTTLSRGAAGFIAVEGNRVPSPASQASGDILYRGTTEWERLAKGTASQVLTMNSGATAPEWATPSSGGMTLLGTLTTTSGTTQPLTSIPSGYLQLYIEIEDVSHNSPSAGRTLTLATSINNGSSYGTAVLISAGLASAAGLIFGTAIVYGISTNPTGAKSVQPYTNTNAAQFFTTPAVISATTTGVIDAIRFAWNASGSFDAGTIRIYGVK
jgi:hypothetical protein